MEIVRGELTLPTESELAALALQGHSTAWGELARRHTRRVVVSLMARGVPLDQAEDLAQDAWVVLMERQRSGRLAELRLPGLAIAQAAWLAREAQRTHQRRRTIAERDGPAAAAAIDLDVADPGPDPADLAAQRERLRLVRDELARCPERARQVFLAVYGPTPCGHDEIARSLGLSVQRVRQILTEVRTRMRRALADSEGSDAS